MKLPSVLLVALIAAASLINSKAQQSDPAYDKAREALRQQKEAPVQSGTMAPSAESNAQMKLRQVLRGERPADEPATQPAAPAQTPRMTSPAEAPTQSPSAPSAPTAHGAVEQPQMQTRTPETENQARRLLQQRLREREAAPVTPSRPAAPSQRVAPDMPREGLPVITQRTPSAPAQPQMAAPAAEPAPASAYELARQALEMERSARESRRQEELRMMRAQSRPAPMEDAKPAQPVAMEEAAPQPAIEERPQGPSQPAPPTIAAEEPAPEEPKTKYQQLKDLLDQYMADEITPQQYHARRSEILAQPE